MVQNPFMFGYESIKILAGLAKGDESVLKNRADIDAQNRIFLGEFVMGMGFDAFPAADGQYSAILRHGANRNGCRPGRVRGWARSR